VGSFSDQTHPPRTNGNSFSAIYYNNQFNSLNDSAITGAPSDPGVLLTSLNGYQAIELNFYHFFSPNLRLGLALMHLGLAPGTTMPAGSPACPGCYIGSNNQNAAMLESYFTF
jgi:hypothetical protein